MQVAVANLKKILKLNNPEKLEKRWYRQYMVQNPQYLVAKRGNRFDYNPSRWTKLSYLTQMYEKIYD